jgi:hypothetical protein
MKENWFAISIFSVIFGILGYLLGMCGSCCAPQNCCSSSQQCSSQQACCAPSGAACCAGGENVFIHKHDGDAAHAIIHELEMADFVGDTTITIDGMTINMTKSEDGDIDVQVEMEEGHGKNGAHVEKTVIMMTDDDGGEAYEVEIVEDEE